MHLDPGPDVDGPLDLDDLDRVVLWGLRCVAVGRADCPSLRRTFVNLYGPAADQILCALLVLVRILACRAGGLRLHMPGSSAVSRDEILILSALALVQEETQVRPAQTLGRELAELTLGGLDQTVVAAFLHAAQLLSGRGRRLAIEPPAARTLH